MEVVRMKWIKSDYTHLAVLAAYVQSLHGGSLGLNNHSI